MIYDLKLHEKCNIGKADITHLVVTRVPGGWLYDLWVWTGYDYSGKDRFRHSTTTFVPFDNEFQHTVECKEER